MGASSRLCPVLFALAVLQAARLASAEQAPTQDLAHQVGDTATLSLDPQRRSGVSNFVWRSFSRKVPEVVATWDAEDGLDIMSLKYVGRVTFLEESRTLKIHNLSIADGGPYEVVELGDSEVLLQKYNLVVFKITTEGTLADDGSCSLVLQCEAGTGARTQVEYSWGPGHKGSTLHLTLHPADKDKPYTCTATALDTQQSRKVTSYKVTPYKTCSSATRAAGLLGAALLAVLVRLLLL